MPTHNSDKIILDLCGATGSWSKPYKDAGYDVVVVTSPQYDVRDVSFHQQEMYFHQNSMMAKWNDEARRFMKYKAVYGILAAPPCTMFSIARTTAFTPRDFQKGMEIVEACLKIIWECRKRTRLAFWALENPRGLLRQFLGRPAMTFQPNEYGDLHTKKTDVWGYFIEPTKRPVEIPNRVKMQLAKNNRILPKLPEGYTNHKATGERSQAARRAMTPPGFAQAFFKANQ